MFWSYYFPLSLLQLPGWLTDQIKNKGGKIFACAGHFRTILTEFGPHQLCQVVCTKAWHHRCYTNHGKIGITFYIHVTNYAKQKMGTINSCKGLHRHKNERCRYDTPYIIDDANFGKDTAAACQDPFC